MLTIGPCSLSLPVEYRFKFQQWSASALNASGFLQTSLSEVTRRPGSPLLPTTPAPGHSRQNPTDYRPPTSAPNASCALGQRNRQRKQAERGNADVLNIHCDSLVNPWRNLIPHSVLAAQFGFKQRHINGPFHAGDHNGCECIAQHIYGHEGGRYHSVYSQNQANARNGYRASSGQRSGEHYNRRT